ncbi:MAG: hypothetical protein IJ685_09630 [Selenomonadaceae bacterium]|nr:hypothetical protein [Selenomonadaceae bacterium]
MKKIVTQEIVTTEPQRTFQEKLMKVASLGKKIRQGLNKKNCSTGKPIDELHGMAKTNAILKNIGDGSAVEGLKRTHEYRGLKDYFAAKAEDGILTVWIEQ